MTGTTTADAAGPATADTGVERVDGGDPDGGEPADGRASGVKAVGGAPPHREPGSPRTLAGWRPRPATDYVRKEDTRVVPRTEATTW
ncbi:hypothetical protein [Streptomyces sp. NPDC001388]|uniref:hypothetical protein n=1 Tax=unclassified Streptomyces TaxID=2593676 RepID=UPI0036C712BA